MIHLKNGKITVEGDKIEVMTEITSILLYAEDNIMKDLGIEDTNDFFEYIQQSLQFTRLVNSGMTPVEAMEIVNVELLESAKKMTKKLSSKHHNQHQNHTHQN